MLHGTSTAFLHTRLKSLTRKADATIANVKLVLHLVEHFPFSVGTPPQMLWGCLVPALVALGNIWHHPRSGSFPMQMCLKKWISEPQGGKKERERSADYRSTEEPVNAVDHSGTRVEVCGLNQGNEMQKCSYVETSGIERFVWRTRRCVYNSKTYCNNIVNFLVLLFFQVYLISWPVSVYVKWF